MPYKRLSKEIARRKKLEAELAELKAAKPPEAAAKPAEAATVYDPVEALPEIRDLVDKADLYGRAAAGVRSLLRQVEDDPDAVAATLREKFKVTLPGTDPRRLREYLEDQHEAMREERTRLAAEAQAQRRVAREELGRRRTSFDAAAERQYAWLADEDDPRTQLAQQILKHPVFGKEPMARFAAAAVAKEWRRYEAGLAQAPEAAKTRPAATMRPAATPTPAPPRTPATRKEEVHRRLRENPTEEAVLEALAEEYPDR